MKYAFLGIAAVLLVPATFASDNVTCAGSSTCTALLQTGSSRQNKVPAPLAADVIEDGSQNAAKPVPVAVVLILPTLDKCRARRAQELAESLSPGFDPWLLHGLNPQPSELIAQLQDVHFRIESQGNISEYGGWKKFGSQLSGYSKAAFLRFMLRHPEYDFAWHVEDDVHFTGSWGKLFLQLQRDFPTQSLVSKIKSHKYNGSKWFMQGCRLSDEHECMMEPSTVATSAELSDHPVHVHVLWLLTRVSHEYAAKLGAQLDTPSGARGHHEAVSGPFCMSHIKSDHDGWCTMGQLPKNILGIFETGHWGDWVSLIRGKREAGMLEPFKLYHPMKCRGEQAVKLEKQ